MSTSSFSLQLLKPKRSTRQILCVLVKVQRGPHEPLPASWLAVPRFGPRPSLASAGGVAWAGRGPLPVACPGVASMTGRRETGRTPRPGRWGRFPATKKGPQKKARTVCASFFGLGRWAVFRPRVWTPKWARVGSGAGSGFDARAPENLLRMWLPSITELSAVFDPWRWRAQPWRVAAVSPGVAKFGWGLLLVAGDGWVKCWR